VSRHHFRLALQIGTESFGGPVSDRDFANHRPRFCPFRPFSFDLAGEEGAPKRTGKGTGRRPLNASEIQLNREVAIKEYLPTSLAYRADGLTVLPRSTRVAADFTWGRDRFVAEGQTLASLHRAPGIVHVFDFLEVNGTAYIVMEMLHGDTLAGRIKRDGPLDPAAVERVLWILLDGLEQVHEAGFLHRDIKPANILLDAQGNPTLIDFGASRAAMADRTTAMTAIFTPGYAAGEQMTSARHALPRRRDLVARDPA